MCSRPTQRKGDWYLGEDFHQEIAFGAPCLFRRHSETSFDLRSLRYTDTEACVRCVEELTRREINLDVNAILPQYQDHFLEFWALVQVGGPRDCWPHVNRDLPRAGRTWHKIVRQTTWFSRRGQSRIAPYRVASWFAWGDTGYLQTVPVCGNRSCCNPLHLRVQHVPHYHHAAKLNAVEFGVQTQTNRAQVLGMLRRYRSDPAALDRFRTASPQWAERLLRSLEIPPAPDS